MPDITPFYTPGPPAPARGLDLDRDNPGSINCPDCGKEFSSEGWLKWHIRKSHSAQVNAARARAHGPVVTVIGPTMQRVFGLNGPQFGNSEYLVETERVPDEAMTGATHWAALHQRITNLQG